MLIRTFKPIVRPLGPRIIKRIHNCKVDIEGKIICDKIYHSEKYKKMDEKLQSIENRVINDNLNHEEEYKKINEKLDINNYYNTWVDVKLTITLIILIFYKN